MIKSFGNKHTEALFSGNCQHRWLGIRVRTERKLAMIDAAPSLGFLRAPPGNHLKALKGSRKGQHSIRINDQWRICFLWLDGDAFDVEIVDYH